jgi:hypothetical protein
MADETPAAEARIQTVNVAHTLGHALSQLFTAEKLTEIQIAKSLHAAHVVAVQTGTYYSAIASVLAGTRLVAAGIGRCTLQVQRGERVERLLLPTIDDKMPEGSGVLRAALGIGFSDTEVRTCDTNLKALDSVMLMIGSYSPMEASDATYSATLSMAQ